MITSSQRSGISSRDVLLLNMLLNTHHNPRTSISGGGSGVSRTGHYSSIISEMLQDPPPLPPCVLLLLGLPGVGKKTVAQRLARIYPQQTRFIVNNLFIDPAAATEPERTQSHRKIRSQIGRAILVGIREVRDRTVVFVLTDCCSNEHARDSRAYEEVVKLARDPDVPLVTMHLTCDERTNLERATSLARRETVWSTKLTDVEILKATRIEYSIL